MNKGNAEVAGESGATTAGRRRHLRSAVLRGVAAFLRCPQLSVAHPFFLQFVFFRVFFFNTN